MFAVYRTPVLGLPTTRSYDPNLHKGDSVLITQGRHTGRIASIISGNGGRNVNPSWKLSVYLSNGKTETSSVVQSRLKKLAAPQQPAFTTNWASNNSYVAASVQFPNASVSIVPVSATAVVVGTQTVLNGSTAPVTATAVNVPCSTTPATSDVSITQLLSASDVGSLVVDQDDSESSELNRDIENDGQQEAQPVPDSSDVDSKADIKRDILAVALSELAVNDDSSLAACDAIVAEAGELSSAESIVNDATIAVASPETLEPATADLSSTMPPLAHATTEEETEDFIVQMFESLSVDTQNRVLRRLSETGQDKTD